MRRILAVLSIMLLLTTVVVACGDDDDDGDGGTSATSTTGGATATTGGDGATATTGGEATATTGGDGGGEGDAAAGEALYSSAAPPCASCHSVDGSTGVGPTWQGLYGHEVELDGGETVTVDDEYIRNSILNPNDQIVAGFAPAMPSYQGVLSDQQINDIIAYIKTLE
jgi:mono/diheme cytochrome c family protein